MNLLSGCCVGLVAWSWCACAGCAGGGPPVPSTEQARVTTRAACTVVEALSGSVVVDSICAVAPELADLAARILASRAAAQDAGAPARRTGACVVIPTTTVCAEGHELIRAIPAVRAARKDGGP